MIGDRPLVSIVTPSFQQGAFLAACVESVLAQDYESIEYRVVDGGSTDGSADILKKFDDRLRWTSAPDRGQADAINRGLRETRGEIVGYVNSDDGLYPGAVRAAVALLRARPNVDIVYGQAMHVNAQGVEVRPYPTMPFDRAVFIEHCFISQPATFWRRSLHDRIGFFAEEFDHTLDYEFWIRAMCAGAKFAHLETRLAFAREHDAAKTQRLRGAIFRQIRDMQVRHLGYCGRNWWEQYLRYLRDECGGWWRGLPGRPPQRLYRLAWWPYLFWRRRLGGPLFYRSGHWRA